jgi:hypothetical protein
LRQSKRGLRFQMKPLDKAVLAVSTTGAADDKPDPATARSAAQKQ